MNDLPWAFNLIFITLAIFVMVFAMAVTYDLALAIRDGHPMFEAADRAICSEVCEK